MSKVYKIGKYYYKQVSEKKSFDYSDEELYYLMNDGDELI